MSELQITCPGCGTRFPLNETLAAEIVAAERRRLEEELARVRTALAERQQRLDEQAAAQARLAEEHAQRLTAAERTLKEQRAALDAEVTRRLDQERAQLQAAIRDEEARRAAEQTDLKLKTLEEQVAEKDARLRTAQAQELELRRERTRLEEERRELELTLERQLDEERKRIRDATRQEADQDARLKRAELEKTISDLRGQIDELRRRSDQGSQQLQGEVLELELEAQLRDQFPRDRLEPVPKGRHGGDVLQIVVDSYGRRCGTILWESKRTKGWRAEWLVKLRDDQRAAQADLAALLSTALPDGITTFGQLGTIWITGPACLAPLAAALRQVLIQSAAARQTHEGRIEKQELVYDYITGGAFRARVSAIAEAYLMLREDLERERQALMKQWSKREKQIERLMGGMIGLYGDMQGIVGSTLPGLDGVGLPQLEGPGA